MPIRSGRNLLQQFASPRYAAMRIPRSSGHIDRSFPVSRIPSCRGVPLAVVFLTIAIIDGTVFVKRL